MKVSGLLIFFVVACTTMQEQNSGNARKGAVNEQVNCMQLSIIHPLPGFENGKELVIGYDSGTTFVYKYNDLLLMQFPYHFDSVFDMNGSDALSEIRYYSLIYTKRNKYGLFSNRHKGIFYQKVPADSILADQWAAQFQQLHKFLEEKKGTLLASTMIPGTDTLKETYSFVEPSNSSVTGQIELFFIEPERETAYSLCPRLDSMKQRQLRRIYYKINPRYNKNGVRIGDPFYIDCAMRKMSLLDSTVIMEMFKKGMELL